MTAERPVEPVPAAPVDDNRGIRIFCLVSVIVLAWVGYLWAAWFAVISTASFFGDTPPRARYIEAGSALLTTVLVAVTAVVVLRLLRYRWNVLWVTLPAVLLVGLAIHALAQTGDLRDPDPGRALAAGDLIGRGTIVNWALTVLFALAAVTLVLLARRGHTRVGTEEGRER